MWNRPPASIQICPRVSWHMMEDLGRGLTSPVGVWKGQGVSIVSWKRWENEELVWLKQSYTTPFWMVYTCLWWFGGWFIVALTCFNHIRRVCKSDLSPATLGDFLSEIDRQLTANIETWTCLMLMIDFPEKKNIWKHVFPGKMVCFVNWANSAMT